MIEFEFYRKKDKEKEAESRLLKEPEPQAPYRRGADRPLGKRGRQPAREAGPLSAPEAGRLPGAYFCYALRRGYQDL